MFTLWVGVEIYRITNQTISNAGIADEKMQTRLSAKIIMYL